MKKSDFKRIPRSLTSNVPLAPFTTLGVGGAARFFVTAKSVEEVSEALLFARSHALPVFVLGGGSNIVISDDGFDGLVLAPHLTHRTVETRDGATVVHVGAGVLWDEFVVWTIDRKLPGLECMSGVPGTVGGAVVANLGAYGAQVSDTFVSADVLDIRAPEAGMKIIQKAECGFSYHDSMFGREPGRYVVLRATFALSQDSAASPSYRDNRFDMTRLREKLGHAPTQEEVRAAVLDMREAKGSLIMSGRVSFKSAGSFFHMPFVSPEQYERVVAAARKRDPEKEENLRPWAWRQPDGTYKVAPGFLLEYTEFQKGYTRGTVGVSPRHTLSIIALHDARAADIARLASDMQRAVENVFGIRLEREVEYIGNVESGE